MCRSYQLPDFPPRSVVEPLKNGAVLRDEPRFERGGSCTYPA